jgi:hypothetical protein
MTTITADRLIGAVLIAAVIAAFVTWLAWEWHRAARIEQATRRHPAGKRSRELLRERGGAS